MTEDAAEEAGGDLGHGIPERSDQASITQRQQLLQWFRENAPPSGTRSAELIREDRDAR
jgi:hypothetical protein